MKNILLNKNVIFVLMLIVPLLLLLFCNYKTQALNEIEHFGVDDSSIKNIFNKLFGLNKTNIKNKDNIVNELDNNVNQLGNITNSIGKINNNLGDNSENSKSIDLTNSKVNDSVNNKSRSDSSNLNVGFEDSDKKSGEDSKDKGNQNNRDINSVVSTDIAGDMSKAKPKDMPLLNKAGGLQQFGSNIVKGDFQQQSEKCKFFGGKCPNGYTRFGTFQIINNAILNGQKLVCDNSISKNNESCAYCCKQ